MNAPGVPQPSTARGGTAYGYDQAGRLVSLDNYLQPAVLADRQQYTFDADDRIIRRAVQEFGAAANTALVDYRYDQTDQLTRADHNDTADETYGYDTLGNRANYTVQPNLHARVVGDGVFNYTYDNEGNLVSKTRIASAPAADWQTTYVWDYRNRLKSVTQTSNDATPAVVTTTYFYDAFDNRITQKVEAGGNVTYTQFAYQGDQLLLARAANGTVTDRFLTGPDGRVLAQDATSGQRWLLADQLGSVRTVMAADGAILGRIDYDSFGKIASGSTTPAAAGSLFGYAGGVYDATTGLDYFRARYYDPFTGRWLSEDPIGFAAGDTNLYRYVGNNPVNATDPTGLSTSYLGNANSYGGPSYLAGLNNPINNAADYSAWVTGNWNATFDNPSPQPQYPLPTAGTLGTQSPSFFTDRQIAQLNWDIDHVDSGTLDVNGYPREIARVTQQPGVFSQFVSGYDQSFDYGYQPNLLTRALVGTIRPFLPPSEPNTTYEFTNGTRYVEMSGGPSSGAMAEQVTALVGISQSRGVSAGLRNVGASVLDNIFQETTGLPIGPSTLRGLSAGPSFGTGFEGEQYLRGVTGGTKTWVRDIPITINEARNKLPIREVDSLAEGIAHESKVGYVNYSEKVAWQILKDRAILRNNVDNIQGVQWHFFESSVTGKAGADPKVLRLLDRSGIPYTVGR